MTNPFNISNFNHGSITPVGASLNGVEIPPSSSLPVIIQGGMGVAVSNWRLARAVSQHGQLGVVSGTALDQVLLRRLQDGDPEGHMRQAFDRFPFPAMAARVWQAYFVPGGKPEGKPYKLAPMPLHNARREWVELCIVANFVEVNLARQQHSNGVGINYMEKLQTCHLASIYGAMLAGVDYILMGAGIPMKIPAVLDHFARNEAATYPLHVAGADPGDEILMHFNPADYIEGKTPELKRPRFLAIISSSTLAVTLAKKANGVVDGFVVEGPTAGGHNAPPRGQLQLDDAGEPIYGERDLVDLGKILGLGRPFWLAGGCGSPDGVRAALKSGATGVQVGTAFAFCAESGMRDDYKKEVIGMVLRRAVKVFTDPFASPTGFPFKVASVEGTVSESGIFRARQRVCDLGFLREAYRKLDGQIGYRCPAEPVAAYVAKGGAMEKPELRKCLCNALMSIIGHAQTRVGGLLEPGIVTAGDDLASIAQFLKSGCNSYHVSDVLSRLLRGIDETVRSTCAQGDAALTIA